MCVSLLKVISCLIHILFIVLLLLWRLFTRMFGALPLALLVFFLITSVLLMTFANFFWICLMHACTNAPRIFTEFKTHVERLLDRKIKCIQSD
jgi:hypothetical protein